ncbi:Disulphide bond corrector protein DsbC [Shimia gijangensis]|uniref:Disulphide bond corrector protein DsbC n=1 Tax=Shimia gijangensis TaxID=1470563 RepID=A0A1M6FD07_9RHOB|nr:protein-disulfide reductase DsbD domain-containing protein [Shimia gijangensis]SHI95533.1 Disulphide bond corrector protein DsbC [Shimia gijangensis]
MIKRLILTALCLTGLALPVIAQSFDRVVQAEVLPGWQEKDGSRIAAIRITLNPGWKTYWRAPGDAGIPPSFDWTGSSNVQSVGVTWPTPEVFSQNGMRSIGYKEELILPVHITPKKDGKQVRFKAVMDIGVCRDICVPQRLKVSAKFPKDTGKRDPIIAAAIASRPLTKSEAGVKKASCRISTSADGLMVTARLHLPSTGGDEIAVIETDNPLVWVSEAKTHREGGVLVAKSELMHVNGDSFMVNRSTLRFTVLGKRHAVDIQGCSAG